MLRTRSLRPIVGRSSISVNAVTFIWKIKASNQKRYFAKEYKSIVFDGNKYEDPWSSTTPTYNRKKPFPTSTYLPYLPSAPINKFTIRENSKKADIDSLEAIGQVVVLEKGEIDKYFPEGLLGDFKKQDSELVHKGQKVGFLIRQEALRTINAIRNTESERRNILIHGVDGSGKSGVLSSVIYWARTHGFVVLVVRNGRDITDGDVIARSVRKPGYFDTTTAAFNTLQGFHQFHRDQIGQIKLKTEFKLPAFKRHDHSTMLDLVEHSLKYKQLSCDVLAVLKGELEATTEFPVLVAVDDISSFFAPKSGFYDPRELKKYYTPYLAPRFLTLVDLFSKKWNLKNGSYVAATSAISKPAFLFRNSNWGSKSSTKLIEVPALRKSEFDALMSYLDTFTYFKRDVPGGERDFVYYMCGGRPKDIMRYSTVM